MAKSSKSLPPAARLPTAGLLARSPCRCQQEIAADVLGEQSPKRLFQVRGKLYELLVNCIPPEVGGQAALPRCTPPGRGGEAPTCMAGSCWLAAGV